MTPSQCCAHTDTSCAQEITFMRPRLSTGSACEHERAKDALITSIALTTFIEVY